MRLGNRRFQNLVSLVSFSVGASFVPPASSLRSGGAASSAARSPSRRLASRAFAAARSAAQAAGAEEALRTPVMPAQRQEPPALPPVAPTAKRLFLVRHGEVVNPGGDRAVYYGGMDVPLSPLGEREAQAAAEYLSRFDISRVYSSPLSRAVYGAEQVLLRQKERRRSSTPPSGPAAPGGVVILDGFTELDRGAWCGLTKDEIGPDRLARFDACDESVTPEGGESYLALKRRVLAARDRALSETEAGAAACLVSHLQVTRCILSEALGVPTDSMVNLKVATASVACVDYDGLTQTVHFQSYKPDVGLEESRDGAN